VAGDCASIPLAEIASAANTNRRTITLPSGWLDAGDELEIE
jgi:hypothetical protein